MEILQKYWYIAVIAFVALFLLARRQGGAQLQQIGGASGDTVALAQIASAEREADEARRFGLTSNLLSYDLSVKQLNSSDALARIGLSQQIDLARISADAQTRAMNNQFSLAALSAQLQQEQLLQQSRLQQYSLERAYNTQRRNDWLGAIGTGLQSIVPYIFADSTNNGGFNFPRTPPIFGNGGGFSFGF